MIDHAVNNYVSKMKQTMKIKIEKRKRRVKLSSSNFRMQTQEIKTKSSFKK